MAEIKTPEQLADERRRDVMAFAYRDKDGKLYTIDEKGRRVEAGQNAKALSPEFQTIADKVAAILMMQRKVLAVSPEERGIITQIMEGNAKDREKLSNQAKDLLKTAASVVGYSYEPETGAFASIVSGTKAPVAALKDVWNAAGEIIDQFGGGEISRENALAFATAYASVRQVAREERPNGRDTTDYLKATFSKDFFAYIVAFVQFGFDKIKGLCGFECTNKSFDQYLDEAMRPADNRRVQHEMTKLPQIGGLDTRDTVPQFTNSGEGQAVGGGRVQVRPADAEHAAPHATDDKGNALPVNPDAAEAARNAQRKGLGERLKQTVQQTQFTNLADVTKDTDPMWLAAGAAYGTGALYQAARGTAEGVARQIANRPVVRMEQAIAENNRYARQAEALREGRSGLRFWESDAAREARAQRLDRKAVEAAEAALKHTEVAEGRAAHAGKFTESAKAEVQGKSVMQWLWNAPRRLGRMVGDTVGFVAEGSAHKASEAGVKLLELGEKVAEESVVLAAKLGQGLKVAAKFGRGIPLAGAVLGGGVVMFSGSAHADTVDGTKLTYFKQLDHDHKHGKISDKEYAYYRGLQTAYVAAGAGGFITAGVTEVAQNGLEYADPVKMDKYLPESIVAMVKGLTKGEKPTGALPADAAMTKAVLQQEARTVEAQAQARAMQSEKPRVGFAYSPMTKNAIGALVNGAPTAVTGSRVAVVASPAVGA